MAGGIQSIQEQLSCDEDLVAGKCSFVIGNNSLMCKRM